MRRRRLSKEHTCGEGERQERGRGRERGCPEREEGGEGGEDAGGGGPASGRNDMTEGAGKGFVNRLTPFGPPSLARWVCIMVEI
jgi:hypothetical protein